MTANSVDFRTELQSVLAKAEGLGFVSVELSSGNLHRRVGGYPSRDHRMPICCEVMYSEMNPNDTIISKPNSGKGATVVIRYGLPR